RTGIEVPPGKRLRVYSLRSIFETQMGNAGLPQTWIDMMMGHVVGGSRGKYAKPSEVDWLEKAKKAEPFISTSRVNNTDSLLDKFDAARKGDTLVLLPFLEEKLGEEKLKQMAKGYLTLKRPIKRPEGEPMPSPYIFADAVEEHFSRKHKKKGPRKR
ncbi:unnamed protein product, partial [marine sediment metagenome]